MLRSQSVWLVHVALTLLSFGSNATKVSAQTTYPFSAQYNTVVNIQLITSEVSQVMESGESIDAMYGLNQFKGLTYYQTNPTTGELSFNIDPTTFGLQGLPVGYIRFGTGTNKLFGAITGSAEVDSENLTVNGSDNVTITGGEGIFRNARGTILFSENGNIISQDRTTTILRGQALASGRIETLQTVPEPGNTTTLVSVGVLGVGFLLRRRRSLSGLK